MLALCRAAHVGDRRAASDAICAAASIVALGHGLPGERVAGGFDEQRRRRDRADCDARRVERRSVVGQRDAGRRVAHGDVHLVARDEALEGGAAVRLRRREAQRDEQLARLKHVLSRRGAELFYGQAAYSVGPGDLASRAPSAISVGIESAAGELLQRLPPRLARDWIWMPPMSAAESIRAGTGLLRVKARGGAAVQSGGRAGKENPFGWENERGGGWRPSRAWMITSVPPARTRADPPFAESTATASVEGRWCYVVERFHLPPTVAVMPGVAYRRMAQKFNGRARGWSRLRPCRGSVDGVARRAISLAGHSHFRSRTMTTEARPAGAVEARTYQQLIGGDWTSPASGETFQRRSPATGELVETIAWGNVEDATRGIKVPASPPSMRASGSNAPAATALEGCRCASPPRCATSSVALGELLSREVGKPVRMAVAEVLQSAWASDGTSPASRPT